MSVANETPAASDGGSDATTAQLAAAPENPDQVLDFLSKVAADALAHYRRVDSSDVRRITVRAS